MYDIKKIQIDCVIKHQAITLTNGAQDLHCRMALPGHNQLMCAYHFYHALLLRLNSFYWSSVVFNWKQGHRKFTQAARLYDEFGNYTCKITTTSLRRQWVNVVHGYLVCKELTSHWITRRQGSQKLRIMFANSSVYSYVNKLVPLLDVIWTAG